MNIDASSAKRRPVVTFDGVVVSAREHGEGCVGGIGLCSSDNRRYQVKDTALGKQLRGLVGTSLEVTGLIEDESSELPQITVNDYFLLRSY